MKNVHKIIFIITLIIACFSAFSLAEINIAQKIDFCWYDENEFSNDTRYNYGKWNNPKYPNYMDFDVIIDKKIISINGTSMVKNIPIPQVDFDNEFLIFATLGEVNSMGQNIKIKEISQRGNVIEIMTLLSSPINKQVVPFEKQYPYDIVKINMNDLVIKGNMLFIFKDCEGIELYRQKCRI